MKRFFPIMALGLILAFGLQLRGQQIIAQNVTTNTVTLPASDAVAQVSNFYGSPSVAGTTAYYYWFVSRTSSNVSVPAGPLLVYAPSSLSSVQNIAVRWTPVGGTVVSYDVLRTTSSATPSGACGCAVAVATALTTLTDQGAALQSYTVPSTGSGWTIKNVINGTVQALMGYYDGVGYQIAPAGGQTTNDENLIIVATSCNSGQANCYVVPTDGKQVSVSGTSGTNVVNCPSGCNFTASDIGKEVEIMSLCEPNSLPTNYLSGNGSTITGVNSSTQITLAENLSGGSPSNACMIYGTANDSEWDAVDNAINTWPTCPHLVLPSGILMMDRPHFNFQPPTCNLFGLTSGLSNVGTAFEVSGQGEAATIITPSWKFAGNATAYCTANLGGSGASCFALPYLTYWHDFSISGFECCSLNAAAFPNLIVAEGYNTMFHVALWAYSYQSGAGQGTGITYVGGGGGPLYLDHVMLDSWGSDGINATGLGWLSISGSAIQDYLYTNILVTGTRLQFGGDKTILMTAGYTLDMNSAFGGPYGLITLAGSASVTGSNLQVQGQGASNTINGIYLRNTASDSVDLINYEFYRGTNTAGADGIVNANGTVKLRGAIIQPGSGNPAYKSITTAGNILFDNGGNQFGGTGVVLTLGTEQSSANYTGAITPGHVASWNTTGILQDGGGFGVANICGNMTPVTVSNTTSETTLMQCTIPANTIGAAGEDLRIRAAGNNNNSSGSNANYVYKLYVDSTVIATHTATNSVTGDKNTFWNIDADVLFSTIGPSGVASADGTVVIEQNSNGWTFPATNGATNVTLSPIDTTASHTIKVTVTLGTASALVAPSEDRLFVDLM